MSTNPIPETDLIAIAERGVIEAAGLWAEAQSNPYTTTDMMRRRVEGLLESVTLLEVRKAMIATAHLDTPQRDPDHFNLEKGGNIANDDYWRER